MHPYICHHHKQDKVTWVIMKKDLYMMADKKIHPLQTVPVVMITLEPADTETADNLWKGAVKSLFCLYYVCFKILLKA